MSLEWLEKHFHHSDLKIREKKFDLMNLMKYDYFSIGNGVTKENMVLKYMFIQKSNWMISI